MAWRSSGGRVGVGRSAMAWMVLIGLAGSFALGRLARSEEDAAPKPPTPEQVARMRVAQQPGPEHERLGRLAGTWDTVTRIWMGPDTETPMEMKGTTRSEMILGGRFLKVANETPTPMGKMASLSLLGFDRRNGVYTTIGFDTMGTYSVSARGKYDEKQDCISMAGEDYDGILDHTSKYRFVIRQPSADRYVVEVIFSDAMHTHGKVDELKVVEVTATRRKDSSRQK